MDTITVLFCAPGYSATKTFVKTGSKVEKHDFNAGMWFTSKGYPITGIHELSTVMTIVEPTPAVLLIRGAPQPELDTSRPHQRTKNGPFNYRTPPRGRLYAMVDIDKLALPAGLKLTKRTLRRVIDHCISLLPAEFQTASFHWQLSSSAGVGDPTKISIHLWFWFDRPITDLELKQWGNAVNAAKGINLIDTSLFNDVQAHYTAAPIFKNMDDPFPVRSGLIEKEQHVVSLVLPASRSAYSKNSDGKKSSLQNVQTGQGFEYHLSTIGDHPGGQGFHGPILSATASHVAAIGGENVDVEQLYERVRDRILSADSSHHTLEEIESRASREHIIPAIEGAIEKFGHQPVRKPRLIMGIPAHFPAKPVSISKAEKCLSNYLDSAF